MFYRAYNGYLNHAFPLLTQCNNGSVERLILLGGCPNTTATRGSQRQRNTLPEKKAGEGTGEDDRDLCGVQDRIVAQAVGVPP